MREVIAMGKTVEEATENGCRELGLERDEVNVEILDLPVSKLFKRTPARVKITATTEDEPQVKNEPVKAKMQAAPQKQDISAEKRDTKSEEAKKYSTNGLLASEPEQPINLAEHKQAKKAADYLCEILKAMGADKVDISAAKQGEATILRVEEGDVASLMEINGEVVQALSYIVDRSVNAGIDKRDEDYLRIRLDIEGYRSRRESELIALAQKVGKEVAATHRSKTLSPMNPYERLIIHTAISEIEGLKSESIGSDTQRRVVVKSTAEDATDGYSGSYNKSGHSRKPYDKKHGSGRSAYQGGKNRQGGGMRNATPQREYANQSRDENTAPVVPERKQAIKDADDLPLYGKIEL